MPPPSSVAAVGLTVPGTAGLYWMPFRDGVVRAPMSTVPGSGAPGWAAVLAGRGLAALLAGDR